ncbi:hypothetical protein [Bradyrhizobium guangzhouense]|uniref:hypothetical protein n=1 Tax=Bradyrhizobium guangzhouense TaxID=1325095 RepID=UPI00100912B7|nr:hypothetical protein [Bradyrhizobium guangzhouense]
MALQNHGAFGTPEKIIDSNQELRRVTGRFNTLFGVELNLTGGDTKVLVHTWLQILHPQKAEVLAPLLYLSRLLGGRIDQSV